MLVKLEKKVENCLMDGFYELQKSTNTSEEALLQIVLSIFSSYRNISFQATGTL